MRDFKLRYSLFLGAAGVAISSTSFASPAQYRPHLITPIEGVTQPHFVCNPDDRDDRIDRNVGEPSEPDGPRTEPDPGPSGQEEPDTDQIILGPVGDAEILLANCHTGPQLRASPQVTRSVTTALENGRDFCDAIPVVWQVSCLADQFRRVARDLPVNGDYGPVRDALEKAARDLDRVTKTYAQPGASKQRYGTRETPTRPAITSAPLTSVAPAAVPQANAAALAIVEETETVLLRSTQNSRNRQLHYQEIAAALDSTKVLLRSA